MRQPKRIDTKDLQGENSYVEVLVRSWGDYKVVRQTMDDEQEKKVPANKSKFNTNEYMEESIIKAIQKWNWTDNEGKPLPLPKDDKSVLDKLTEAEIVFLFNAYLDKTDQKN